MSLDLPQWSLADHHDVADPQPVSQHELLAHGYLMDMVRDTVELESGPVVRDYTTHPGSVAVIAVDDQDRVVVVHQYRHPVGWRLVEPPAGLLDVVGEDTLVAAQRELAEEAQIQAAQWHLLVDAFLSPGGMQEHQRIFLARGLSAAAPPDGFEAEGEEVGMPVGVMPLDELVTAVLQGRLQNPALCIGVLATAVAQRDGYASLRSPQTPWPARERHRNRDQ
ncbi:NUDIX domain-containing protein [Parenemella sanctibonifatiensis]|uniref:ADP-ribose pyrophosphatase n=1 Tax=Parenemella sanctibonifatiensis TaxID=2016505 RepID=A0A255EIG4_9ACTN|nr:NUDIX hydrolase [Parenemella sanctibonifatiensis]OYN91304.1 ADP-ribose pyrophosphatase [Parenemella sanctibonifatiensis]